MEERLLVVVVVGADGLLLGARMVGYPLESVVRHAYQENLPTAHLMQGMSSALKVAELTVFWVMSLTEEAHLISHLQTRTQD
jgi:uncharacterized membrane protein YkvI